MESNDDEIKLLYLLSGSCDALPPNYVKLRSYMNIHLSNIADQHNLQLLKNFRNRNKTCPYCYSPWNGDTTFKLLPSKRFKAPQVASDENGKSQACQLSESRNKLVLTCKVCSKKSAFSLIKRKPVKEKVEDNKILTVKKKKKKRDKSCGLHINLIKPQTDTSETLILKKKKRTEGTNGTSVFPNPQSGTPKSIPISKNISNPPHSQNTQAQKNSKNNSNSVTGNSKNFLPNPFSSHVQHKLSKKKDKKLERLKKAVGEDKKLPKKTLKDFLTLI